MAYNFANTPLNAAQAPLATARMSHCGCDVRHSVTALDALDVEVDMIFDERNLVGARSV